MEAGALAQLLSSYVLGKLNVYDLLDWAMLQDAV